MLVYKMKMQGIQTQYLLLDAAIRKSIFVCNRIIIAWINREVKSHNDTYKYCTKLAHSPDFSWAKQLNSMAKQA